MKTKVLIISTVGLIYDGITNVITSYLQAMDLSGLDVYVISTIKEEKDIVKKIENTGCHIVKLPSRKTQTVSYFLKLITFIKKNHINVVHAHGNSGTLSIEMLAAWIGGSKKRIAHSHNTKCDQVKADKILRPIFNVLYTDGIACGEDAGRWLFGNRPFTILSNGRDIKLFSFDENIREKKRTELNLKSEIAIGHVGGFFEQKNHRFLLEIFREILKKNPTVRFYLIGDGPLRPEIESSALDLKDNLTFVGTTSQIADYLQAMDGMLLPSLYEGLPLVAIEWQINGLPCVLSDKVTKECAFMDNCVFMSLNGNTEAWAREIIALVKSNDRIQSSKKAALETKIHGFDIQDGALKLRNIYCG